MTEDKKDDQTADLDAMLPQLRERARDQIQLMFLIDDFERALLLNQQVVEATTERFSGKIASEDLPDLEAKLTPDMLMVREMTRHMADRGKALISQVNKIASEIPSWDPA